MELILVVFDREPAAGEVLADLRKLEKEHVIRLFNAAVLEKDQEGKTRLKETQDIDAKHGAVAGAITGGVIGLIGGPLGALLGAAAGAATGGVAASKIDLGFSNDFINEVRTGLGPGSSVLMVLVEPEWNEAVVEELERQNGSVLRHVIRADVIAHVEDLE